MEGCKWSASQPDHLNSGEIDSRILSGPQTYLVCSREEKRVYLCWEMNPNFTVTVLTYMVSMCLITYPHDDAFLSNSFESQ
jgi:hypothetical protein